MCSMEAFRETYFTFFLRWKGSGKCFYFNPQPQTVLIVKFLHKNLQIIIEVLFRTKFKCGDDLKGKSLAECFFR